MHGPPPPTDLRHRPGPDRPTWRDILASYALAAAIPLSLWIVSRPLAGAVVLAAVAGLVVAARRAPGVTRCLRDCRGIAFDLGDAVRITVTWDPADDANACAN